MLKAILQEMRVRQYTKNAFVFIAPMFSGRLMDEGILEAVILAFIAFCSAASTVYIGNDICDREKDRQHPVKCHRPIAAGVISVPNAALLAIVLFIVSMALSFAVDSGLSIVILLYLVMNVAYSWKLKHIVIIDVMIIAFGFVLRAFAGVIVAGVNATTWFILCVMMLSLFLALAKRRGELILLSEDKSKQRKVLQDYSVDLLNTLIIVVCAVMLTSYALFAQNAADEVIYGLPLMMITVPIVIYGVFRYLYLMFMRGRGEKPEDVLLQDKHILSTVILYMLCIFILRDI